jgi:hypothetical protein
LEEGTLSEEGASSTGRIFRAQIAVRYVLEGGYILVSEYCGRVSPSELPVGRELQFSGLDNIYQGRTFLEAHLLQLALCCILDQVVIVSGSYIYCTCCIPPFILPIYTLIFQTGFPRGVLSRVMLTKNTCVHFHVC